MEMSVPPHPDENRVRGVDEPALTHTDTRAPLEEMPSGSFESSNVHSAIYDFGERKLFVRYLREGPDAIYQYWDVPASEWQGLEAAASKGSYINANIAFDYRYALFGRDEFPDRSASTNMKIRRFVYAP